MKPSSARGAKRVSKDPQELTHPLPNSVPDAKRSGIYRRRDDLSTKTLTLDPGAPDGRPGQVDGGAKTTSVILNLIQDPVIPASPLGPKSSLG